ncbi:MAG: protein kinase [Pirellulales bacterium]
MPVDLTSAKSIFLQAVELYEPADWPGFLERACGDRPELRREVEMLLESHVDAKSFLEAGVGLPYGAIDWDSVEKSGDMIGPYRLLEEIGQGGMGTVYRAEQQRPVHRTVALKIIKPGMDSRQVIARFEAERQSLSLMDHPHIARVLDAGTTDRGRPYFVMELVKGEPITTYCDVRQLPLRERLELFLSVCQAIQHAHQKGIIHRDIKPSNVLTAEYDGCPMAKVIDFGIAKAMGQPLADGTMLTSPGQVMGTPEYMSPEQASLNVLDIDTRSDVYSLGVLLYELLTGTTPFDRHRLRTASLDEMLRIIREEDPPKPSTRLTAAGKSVAGASTPIPVDSVKLERTVRSELDWIVMKGLEKDRSRRYETADRFAADIQRYLADEPVEACPPTLWYRFGKFARRNKAALATATLLSLTFIAAVGAVAAAFGWAIRNRSVLEQQVSQDRQNRRETINREAGRALEDVVLASEHGRLPEAIAHLRRADVNQGSGDLKPELEQAVRRWREALAMAVRCEEIRLERIQPAGDPIDWAKSDRAYGEAFQQYDLDLAKISADAAAARITQSVIRQRLVAALDDWWLCKSPGQLEDRSRLFDLLQKIDRDSARARFRAAFERREVPELIRLSRQPEMIEQPAPTICLLATMLNSADATAAAVELLEKSQMRHATDFWVNFDLANSLIRLKAPRTADAVGFYRVAASLRPNNALVHQALGYALWLDRKPAQAAAAFHQSLEFNSSHPTTYMNLGVVANELGDFQASTNYYLKALELKPDYLKARLNLGISLSNHGDPMGALAQLRQAIRLHPTDPKFEYELFAQLVKLRSVVTTAAERTELTHAFAELVQNQPDNALAHAALGSLQFSQRNWDGAKESYQRAIDLRPGLDSAHSNLAWIYANSPEPSIHDLPQALRHAKSAVAANPENRLSWYHMASIEYRAGMWQQAADTLQKAERMEGPPDYFHRIYLVLTNWRLGRQQEALQHWIPFTSWMDIAGSTLQSSEPLLHEELLALRAEAENLLGDFRSQESACREVLRVDPKSVLALTALGNLYAQSNRWDESRAAFRQAFEIEPPQELAVWLTYASTLIQARDLDAYRRLCRRMESLYGDSGDPVQTAFLAHTCVLGPDALGDTGRVLSIAEERFRLTAGMKDHSVWSPHVLGLALVRGGQTDQAIQCLENDQRRADLADDIRLSNYLALALAYQQAGRTADANRTFQMAQSQLSPERPVDRQPLTVQILFLEADAALHPP